MSFVTRDRPPLDIDAEILRIDRQRRYLQIEIDKVRPVTTLSLCLWSLTIVAPLAFGVAIGAAI